MNTRILHTTSGRSPEHITHKSCLSHEGIKHTNYYIRSTSENYC